MPRDHHTHQQSKPSCTQRNAAGWADVCLPRPTCSQSSSMHTAMTGTPHSAQHLCSRSAAQQGTRLTKAVRLVCFFSVSIFNAVKCATVHSCRTGVAVLLALPASTALLGSLLACSKCILANSARNVAPGKAERALPLHQACSCLVSASPTYNWHQAQYVHLHSKHHKQQCSVHLLRRALQHTKHAATTTSTAR